MAKSVNKVILVGNVGGDPDVKYTPSGTPVAKLSLATNDSYKDKGGEWRDRAEWHHVVAWQRLAEIVGDYVQKGTKLYIEGKLQTSSWEDRQTGEKRYRTEIVAQNLVLLGNGRTDIHPTSPRVPRQQMADAEGESAIRDENIPF